MYVIFDCMIRLTDDWAIGFACLGLNDDCYCISARNITCGFEVNWLR